MVVAAAGDVGPGLALEPHYELCRVRLEHVDGKGMGMVCREAVHKGEELLRVSLSKAWTVEGAKASKELAPLGEELLEALPPESLLALHILVVRALGEEAPEAALRDHLRVLQAAEFETLMDWSPEELQMLQGSKWAMLPQVHKQDLVDEFSDLQEIAGDFFAKHGIDVESFLWAHRLLVSRSIHFSMEDGTTLIVLAPGQDLFNHSLDAPVGDDDVNLVRGEDGNRSIAVRAIQELEAGEEAVYSYRAASNGRLLMMGGFVLPGNPFDAVELQFQLPACSPGAEPLFKSLAEGLKAGVRVHNSAVAPEATSECMETLEDGSIALHVQLAMQDVGAQLERVLAFFRLVRLCRQGAVPSPQELAASDTDKELRRAVLSQLREHLLQMLAQYPTALVQDEEALRAAEASSASASAGVAERRRESSLRVLVGEKQIFARALAWLGSSIDVLDAPPTQAA